MEKLKHFFDNKIFTFKGIMICSLFLSYIILILVFFQPALSTRMMKFWGHFPEKKQSGRVSHRQINNNFDSNTLLFQNSKELNILYSKIDSLELRIDTIEKESSEPDIAAYRGTFGDMYGSLNSLFSGIGIVGLVVTILIQIIIHKKELKSDNLKIEKERQDQKSKHEQDCKNKIAYLLAIYRRITECNSPFVLDVKEWLNKNPSNTCLFKNMEISTTEHSLIEVSNKIDKQDMYQSYKELAKNDSILLSFEQVDSLLTLRRQIIEALNKGYEYTTKYGEQVNQKSIQVFDIVKVNAILQKMIDKNEVNDANTLDKIHVFFENLDKKITDFEFKEENPNVQNIEGLMKASSLIKLILIDLNNLKILLNEKKEIIDISSRALIYTSRLIGISFTKIRKSAQ